MRTRAGILDPYDEDIIRYWGMFSPVIGPLVEACVDNLLDPV